MNIDRFRGKTEEEARELAKKTLGPGCKVMTVRVVKPKGLFGFLKPSEYEVTAAVDDEHDRTITPASALNAAMNMHDKISERTHSVDLAADERLDIRSISASPAPAPAPVRPVSRIQPAQENTQSAYPAHSKDVITDAEAIEEKLGQIQNLIEQSQGAAEKSSKSEMPDVYTDEEFAELAGNGGNSGFVKALYKTLIDNEVDEKYVNRLLEDLMKVIRDGSSVDYILSNVYQKMVLNLGKPQTIPDEGRKPQVIFFIGPTGVGKTTTIAKLASEYKVEKGKRVAFLTADTYRIAATEQLRTYANILDAPLTVIYSESELNTAIDNHRDYDYVFVDTAGFSHKNEKQKDETKKLLSALSAKFTMQVFLVLSATTKYRDLKEICDMYRAVSDYAIIFTKLDETAVYGNIYNIRIYTGAAVSYITNGQNVPDDIAVFDTQAIVKKLLGGE